MTPERRMAWIKFAMFLAVLAVLLYFKYKSNVESISGCQWISFLWEGCK